MEPLESVIKHDKIKTASLKCKFEKENDHRPLMAAHEASLFDDEKATLEDTSPVTGTAEAS